MYKGNYTPLSREEIIEKVSEALSARRLKHVLGVEEAAIQLAERYDADVEKVSIAALLHDYAKEQSDEEMRDVIISENMDLELLQYGNNIWHGPVGAILVKKLFGIEDEEILDAIRHHTVGSPTMGLIEQIIYVADFIEPGRSFPGVETARELAEHDLKETIAFSTIHTIEHLLEKNIQIYPKAIETYNAWAVAKK
jgi:predicted HD superfamily hydrolase involved in NAD metabolism